MIVNGSIQWISYQAKCVNVKYLGLLTEFGDHEHLWKVLRSFQTWPVNSVRPPVCKYECKHLVYVQTLQHTSSLHTHRDSSSNPWGVTSQAGKWPSREPCSEAGSILSVLHKPLHSPARFHRPSPQAPDVGGSKVMGVQSSSPSNKLIQPLSTRRLCLAVRPLPSAEPCTVLGQVQLAADCSPADKTSCVWHRRRGNTARSKGARCGGRSWLSASSAAAACCHRAKWAVHIRAELALGKTGVFSAPALGIPCTPYTGLGIETRQRKDKSCRLGRWTVSEEDLRSCSSVSHFAWLREKYNARWHETQWIWISCPSRH